MFLRKAKETTDPHLRSLVQKAFRRGYGTLVRQALEVLHGNGDARWIRSRAAVLAAEECWSMLSNLPLKATPSSRINWISSLATKSKFKDAAGLGTLAYVASNDDLSVYGGTEDDRAIRVLAAALKRPNDYWAWALKEAESIGCHETVRKLQSFVAWPTWPWDKAFVFAVAFLTIHNKSVIVTSIDEPKADFPYWVAIDKHTAEGKAALRAAAKVVGCSYRQINWVSYYLESAQVNALGASPWWIKEQNWRLRKVGLSVSEAQDLWKKAREIVSVEVTQVAAILKQKIESRLITTLELQ